MKRIYLGVLSAVFLASISVPASLHAATIYVGSCGTPNKPTIQLAVTASAAGGTVLVCPGTYPEQVTITKNLTLQGQVVGTAGQVVITPPASGVVQNTTDLYEYGTEPVAAQVLVQNAKQVVVNNITVDGAGNGLNSCALDIRGIYYQNASGTIENVTTRNQTLVSGSEGLDGCQDGQGIYVQSGYGTSTVAQYVAILNNNVRTFQKNGITVDGSPLTFLMDANFILGQGPTTGAAENGIQISDGATGSALYNTVLNDVYSPGGYGASGILIYSSAKVELGFNGIGSTQYGIATVSDPTYPSTQDPTGVADYTNIHDNVIEGTQLYDGIDLCSNHNTVVNNRVFSSTESAIHLDSTCGSTGTNNVVTSNTINEACAGVLEGATPNTVGGASLKANNYFNVTNTVLAGNVCPVASLPTALANIAKPVPQAGARGAHPTPVR